MRLGKVKLEQRNCIRKNARCFSILQPGTIAIPRTTRKERLAENAAIFDFALSGEEMAAISALAGAGNRICDYDFSPKWDV